MKTKKNESSYTQKRFNEKLEKSSKLFTLLGLVTALFVVYVLIEYETKQIEVSVMGNADLTVKDELLAPLIFRKEIPQKKVEQTKAITETRKEIEVFEKPKIVKDKTKLSEVITKNDPEDSTCDLKEILEIVEPEEVFEDVAINFVEEAPVFPGCVGDKEALRKCLAKNIQKHINRKFDVGLGQELGLSPGRNRIFVVFKIDRNGQITDVMTRAPHPRLKKEAERVVRALPQMKAGRQGNRAVGVKYSIPITFEVQ